MIRRHKPALPGLVSEPERDYPLPVLKTGRKTGQRIVGRTQEAGGRNCLTAALFATCIYAVLLGTAYAEDTITLHDGHSYSGLITKEDPETVFLQDKDGETRAIAKSRIAAIAREKAKPAAVKPVADAKKPEPPKNDIAPPADPPDPDLLRALKDIGSPDPDRRAKALAKAVEAPAKSIPLLVALLSPKGGTDEFTQIGALRALGEVGPLPEIATKSLAWASVFATFPEARREACCTIRKLRDDKAIAEIVRLGVSENAHQRQAAAAALREIDDPRVLVSLIRALPHPSVTANMGDQPMVVTPGYNLPIGPAGARIPIFLPEGPATGVTTDISSPAGDLLKMIAGKDLGNLPASWGNWFNEKGGMITATDRDVYREHRSMRDRMNAP